METINKVAVLISWPRELDMFSIIINNIDNNLFVIIVDDFIYKEREREGNAVKIIELLGGLPYVLLSDVVNRIRYKYLFSTAQAFKQKITAMTFAKFLLSKSIGVFIEVYKLDKILIKTFGRPLSGGGKKAKNFKIIQIERLLGVKTIRFPKGLDVSAKRYPVERWRGVFDLHLCHSDIDYNLVRKKFSNEKCLKIGYPRYDNVIDCKKSKNIINKEFSQINSKKPLIVWVSAHIKIEDEFGYNIELWAPVVKKLTDEYNVIVRPHPKTCIVGQTLINNIKESRLIIDQKFDRKMNILYQAADVILADYGGSVLDSIYMKKNIILLNMPNTTEFYKWRIDGKYLDNYVRNNIKSVDYKDDLNLHKLVDSVLRKSNELNLSILRDKYFKRDGNYIDVSNLICKLENELKQN
ncbi:hypothetical protein HOL24_04735 [bacterium]|jgi:hypothetical protein|nr:hypothetical protein [bacterium]